MSQLSHGGRLRQATVDYQIPLLDWLDLSTGVSPWTYPFNEIEISSWNRLPEVEDGLERAAKTYYKCSSLLPVAGSQAAIQQIPKVWSEHIGRQQSKADRQLRVGLPYQGYKEHELAWYKAGWSIVHYHSCPDDALVTTLDALVVINPNNPVGIITSKEMLLRWHQLLSKRNGLLVVDEAFADQAKAHTLSQLCPINNLVVLRSVGKFFGLAGIRVGFVLAQNEVLKALDNELGPWTISGPSRSVCMQALSDRSWQSLQKQRLNKASQKLRELLSAQSEKRKLEGDTHISGTSLFQTWYLPDAKQMHHRLCQQGIFVRLTDEKDALRFGLPKNDSQWKKLTQALAKLED